MKGKHIEINTLMGKSILILVFAMMLVAPSLTSAADGVIENNQSRMPVVLASSSLFNSIVNKAKETAEQVIDNSIEQESNTQKETTAPTNPVSSPSSPEKTGYDPVLVKNIQTRLNALGYNAGKPDGLYGSGTRNAIMAFQKDHSLAATGTPSDQLLSQLNQAKPVAMETKPSKASSSSQNSNGLPTSSREIAKAIMNLEPRVWDTRPDRQLKKFVQIFYPNENKIFNDEFYWHKRKGDLKDKILAESKGAQTSFEVAPWINNALSTTDTQTNNLRFLVGNYDFEKQMFPIYYKPNEVRLPWTQRHAKYSMVPYRIMGIESKPKTFWLKMPPDKAEKLVKQMKLGNTMFGHFQFTVTRIVGVDPEDHPDYDKYKKYMASPKHKKGIIEKNLRPIAEVKIKGNSIDFYVQKKNGNIKQFTSKSDFEYVTSLNISS